LVHKKTNGLSPWRKAKNPSRYTFMRGVRKGLKGNRQRWSGPSDEGGKKSATVDSQQE